VYLIARIWRGVIKIKEDKVQQGRIKGTMLECTVDFFQRTILHVFVARPVEELRDDLNLKLLVGYLYKDMSRLCPPYMRLIIGTAKQDFAESYSILKSRFGLWSTDRRYISSAILPMAPSIVMRAEISVTFTLLEVGRLSEEISPGHIGRNACKVVVWVHPSLKSTRRWLTD
jgi:hypothetical protein